MPAALSYQRSSHALEASATINAVHRRCSMPIRWYGPANPEDPIYRHFSRIVNLTLHAGVFAAINSGLWFVQGMRHPWEHLAWFTDIWFTVLVVQLITVIAQRPGRTEPVATTPTHPPQRDQP